jgi:hypothetical protein
MRTFKLTAICSLLATAAGSPRTAAAFSANDPARVLYVGDSLAANTLDTVSYLVASTGKARVFSKATPNAPSGSIFGGMAICDFLDNTPSTAVAKLTPLIQEVKPHLVVMQFWGNLTACMGGVAFASEDYYTRYFWDAAVAATEIQSAATAANIPRPKILWVLQGPDRDHPERTKRLNEIYAAIAANAGDRTTDAGRGISMAAYPFDDKPKDRYAWTQYLPCTNVELGTGYCTNPTNAFNVPLAKLHTDTDAVHFCLGGSYLFFACDTPSPAILRYSLSIAGDTNAWLGI